MKLLFLLVVVSLALPAVIDAMQDYEFQPADAFFGVVDIERLRPRAPQHPYRLNARLLATTKKSPPPPPKPKKVKKVKKVKSPPPPKPKSPPPKPKSPPPPKPKSKGLFPCGTQFDISYRRCTVEKTSKKSIV